LASKKIKVKNVLKKINFLITKRQRKGLFILILLLFMGMILEVFGLGILIPALTIILDPEMLEQAPLMSSIKRAFPDFSHKNLIYFFLGAIVLVYFLKSLFLVFLTHKQNRFLSNITAYISNNLFSSYLRQPYSFHLDRNASELIKNIQVEINYLYTFLLSLITLFIEGGFIIAVLATLVYIEPLGAISIGVFYGLLSIIFLQFTKKKLNQWGILRQDLDAQVSKIALESLGGIKDLIISGNISFFKNKYSNKNFLKARLIANQGTVSQIPRFYLEFISIIGLVTFIILLLYQGKDITSLITVLGVFVAATFRMIPSLNRIIGATQSMKFYRPSLDVIYNEIIDSSQIIKVDEFDKDFNFQNNFEFKNVSFNFIEGDVILKEINLKIKKGETIGITGESGSGKSTLVDLLIGLLKPISGEILIDGYSCLQYNQCWKKSIGYVSQSIYLTDDTIKNNIALGIPEDKIDYKRINELLKKVQLEKFIASLELGFDTKVGERGVQLSGGQRQRIGIARALYNNPDILILDEATSALDTETEKEVMDSIYRFKGSKTIIIIAHRLTTLDNCDRILKIKASQIINC
jgi:ABC-type multidrug transport system fused ATPase/permease subunit